MVGIVATVVTPTKSRNADSDDDICDWVARLETGGHLTSQDWDNFARNKDRFPLLRLNAASLPSLSGKIVRMYGMVQDMLDVEYFTRLPNSSVTLHCPSNTDILERWPTIIHALDQHKNGFQEWFNTLLLEKQHTSKRMKLDFSCKQIDTQLTFNQTLSDTSVSAKNYGLISYFYHEQYKAKESLRKVRLNDVVELVGVLEIPSEDDDELFGICESSGWEHEEFSLEEKVPLVLPKIHVLWFDASQDLDSLVASQVCTTYMAPVLETTGLQSPSSILAHVLSIPETVSTALYLSLLSMAERECLQEMDSIWTPVSLPTNDSTLGCASLNITIKSTTTPSICSHFHTRLINVLSQIVPHVVSLDITSQTLATLEVPSKRHGQLIPTLLQLPKGSTLILNILNLQAGSFTGKKAETLKLLQQLIATHKMRYTFDGGIQIPFEADIRIIVLSLPLPFSEHEGSTSLFPCSLQVDCHLDNAPLLEISQVNLSQSLLHVRQALAACRQPRQDGCNSYRQHNNISLSTDLLEKAQQDFISRRVLARQDTRYGDIPSEKDLHRWLTLTRLFARSRRSTIAELEDWNSALVLDDEITKHSKCLV